MTIASSIVKGGYVSIPRRYERLSLEEHILMSSLIDGEIDNLPDKEIESAIVEKLGAKTLFQASCFYFKIRRGKMNRHQRTTLKIQLMAKHGFCCVYCGRDLLVDVIAFASVTIDHIKPRGLGGSNANKNLTIACSVCNTIKADVSVKSVEEGREVVRERLQEIEPWLEEARRMRDGEN